MSSSPAQAPVIPAASVNAVQTQNNVTAGEQSQAGSGTNQSNWLGNTSYQQTGTINGVPQYTQTTSLSPEQEQLYQQYVKTAGLAGNQAGSMLANSGYGTQTPAQAIGSRTAGLTGDLVNQETAYLNPFYTAQTSQLDTQLRNQGFDPSSPAYKTAMMGLLQNQNQGIQGFIANTQPQLMQQATQEYQMPLTMGAQLAQWGAPQSPNSQFVQTPQLNIAPSNFAGEIAQEENTALGNAGIQNQYNTAGLSGAFGIGSGILGGWAKNGGVQSLLGAAALA